ncbi:MAG: class I SAM-dependent methyltransferase [Candidatus Omnitrophica bacterium]|nr:class I SAM-dependent methyltransferase [Candidatus Omnitrophota bacterium]MCM8831803.1 class I SAM-dependent methyltransferase [Candidatus Omnitrophota bacterium]
MEKKKIYDKDYFETRKKSASLPHNFQTKRYHFEIIVNTFRYLKPKKVLDCGCAKGFLVYLFDKAGIDSYGIDISEYAINSSPENIRNKLSVVDVVNDKFPFCDNYFDLIVGLEIIEHLDSFDNFLKECYRVLKSNGYLFFTTPTPGSWDAIGDITHINVHPKSFWLDLIKKYNFVELTKQEYKIFIKNFIKNYKKFIAFTPSERGIIKFLYKFGWFGKFLRSQFQVYINFFSPLSSTQLLIFKKI